MTAIAHGSWSWWPQALSAMGRDGGCMHGTFLVLGALLLLTLAPDDAPAPGAGIWLQIALEGGLAALLMLLARSLLRRHPDPRSPHRFQTAATAALAVLYLWWSLGLGLAAASPSLTVALVPLLILLSVAWWLGAGIGQQRLDHHLRWSLLRQRWRFGLALPLILILAHDAVRLVQWMGPWTRWFGEGGPIAIGMIAETLLLVVLVLGLPNLLAWVWAAQPIREPLAGALRRLCHQAGLRSCRFYQWPSRELPFYNAMAVGVIGRFRAIFISADLLDHLDDDQRDAVIGHEIGHLRHNHHLLFILLLITATTAGTWAGLQVEYRLIQAFIPEGGAPIVRGFLIGLYLLLLIRGAFGMLSRACERQADLVGSRLCGSPRAMQAALLDIAALSGQPLDAPSWRHHSIASRVAFLDRVRSDPGLADWHHWRVSMFRLILILALAIALLLQLTIHMQPPELADLREQDPQLDRAIAQALAGESRDFYDRVTTSEPLQRQRLATAILRHLARSEEEVNIVDPRPLREQIELLRPFLRAGTGNERLQIEIRNTVAYALVAGRAQPDERDLAEAEILYDDLLAEVAQRDSAHLRDTLGSIDLRLGRYEQAAEHFAQALNLLNPESESAQEQAFLALLRQRLGAAQEQRSELPLEWSPEAPTPATQADDTTDDTNHTLPR